ncbi:hypothetical protein DFH08DRAFT_162391 [Mycena albidolilacea]|uniref:Uncharacterized protein n=1 Tax=Mycena albidolilacea TaxID=1033008 RepID=A0AAD7ESB8_9AGAR|nr:hypothetical protein DFH08DRAFT_162391 [Mycena albidolilacea]
MRCIITRRCGSHVPAPSHRRAPPRRPRDTTSPLCHRPLRLCPPSRCVCICATHPSALHAHRVPHAALQPSAHPRWSRHSHPRAAHLCTLRTIQEIVRPAPRRLVFEIAFVHHWDARPQYRHDRPSTTIVFVKSHCTSHSPISPRIAHVIV